MIRRALSCLALSCLALLALAAPAPAQEALRLDFLPPPVERQDLCLAPGEAPEGDLSVGESAADITTRLHLRYLRRDIRALTIEDPDRWFDFIQEMRTWEAELDPGMTDADLMLAQIALHVDAGRLEALQASGLIARLRTGALQMSGQNKLELAQYYLGGIGVVADLPYAYSLIRDAAFGGNVDALMQIARMAAAGTPMPDWNAPLDLTVTLAFGGMLGAMDGGICARAERIAREYLDGRVVQANQGAALAWYRFAADLGSAQAAWRVVEFHLSATAPAVDNAQMLDYLQRATDRGFRPDAGQSDVLLSASGIDIADLRRILGANISMAQGEGRANLTRYLQLALNPDGIDVSAQGPYLDYLRTLVTLPHAPGFVFTRLATQIDAKEGRWAAEAEIMAALDAAVARGDGQGMRMRAAMELRYRADPARLSHAVSLLTRAATELGLAPALDDLDGLYRCQVPDAPQQATAAIWSAAYRASEHAAVDITATDLLVLAPWREPETLARIQRQALEGRSEALSQMLQRVQVDPLLGDSADALWARRTQQSDRALELFAELEFTLATSPAERDQALELFRRVYLNNGVTTALDLAVALTEHAGRDPAIADEIITLLTQAGNRGEGAAIRLLARLLADNRSAASLHVDPRPAADVYADFDLAIAERGDFLALMFAIPFVDAATAADYMDRAVSIMSCGSKDTIELADAAAILQDPAGVYHWHQVALNIEGGFTMSRLALTARQMAAYGTRVVPGVLASLTREEREAGGQGRGIYALLSDPDAPGYDPARAGDQLVALLRSTAPGDAGFALTAYRAAPADLRAAVDAQFDVGPVFARAAAAGDPVVQYDYGLLLQAQATGPTGLAAAATWLARAAEGGHVPAMGAWGQALALGLGTAPDRTQALVWLDRARAAGDARAAELAHLLRLAQ